MALIGLSPMVQLLLAAEQAAATVDFVARAGTSKAVTLRHTRSRAASRGERPSLSFRFVEDDVRDANESERSVYGEQVKDFAFDMIAEADLATEESGEDPTGLALLSRMLAAAYEGLIADGSPLQLRTDHIRHGAISDDEESTPDIGRLEQRVVVVYRVRSDQPNQLLWQGETP